MTSITASPGTSEAIAGAVDPDVGLLGIVYVDAPRIQRASFSASLVQFADINSPRIETTEGTDGLVAVATVDGERADQSTITATIDAR